MAYAWGPQLVGQLEYYWDAHLRPRLDGLTDHEYFWEPAPGCWNVRRDTDGRFVADEAWPPPEPPPVTTIAWRMMHIAIGCFADRAERFFDTPGGDALPGTAAEALAFMDDTYHRWRDRVAALDEAGIEAPLGERGGPFAAEPMGALILHINREVMHHGGEIGVLRDLYRATVTG
jgi:hypothetical protein